jgi:exodeoxyribonuclease VIII
MENMHLERNDAANWSSIKYLGISAKHYLHALSTPRTDTDALKLGRLVHCLVLEPEQVNGRYTVEPRFNKAMKNETAIARGYSGGKEAAAEWLANVGDREPVGSEMYATAYAMAQAVLADPVAAPIVSSGWSEARIEWTDAETGILCRGRPDHLGSGILADLKTTRNLSRFENDVARFGYFAQLAWYLDGLHTAGLQTIGDPCLIAVESVAPYDVLVLTFNEDDLNVGRRVYRACLNQLSECRRTGRWPGVSNGVARRVVLPAWAGPVEDEITLDGEKL